MKIQMLKFFKGAVTNAHGAELSDEAYITYGVTNAPDDEAGDITIKGENAVLIAERICKLLNAERTP